MTTLSSGGQATPGGEDWWQASDGNWYPPSAHPGYAAPIRTGRNGKAVAALVLGIFGFIGIFTAGPAIALGFIARSEIRHSQGRQSGAGMALAGLILGILWTIATIATAVVFWDDLMGFS